MHLLTRTSFFLIALLSCVQILGCHSPEAQNPVDAADSGNSALDTSGDGFQVLAQLDGGTPLMVAGRLWELPAPLNADSISYALSRVAQILNIEADQLRLVSLEQDDLGFTHARYEQRANGLPVVGGILALHIDPTGLVFAATGTPAHIVTAALPETIKGAEALNAASGMVGLAAVSHQGQSPALVYVVTRDHLGVHLAWEVIIEGADQRGPVSDAVYVDALSREIVAVHPRIYFARSRVVSSAEHTGEIPGTRMRQEGEGASVNIDVNAAYDNTGYVYDYYKTIHGRDSFDAKGGQILSTVNYAQNYNNAYWDGTQMVYGDGDGEVVGPMARAIDVTAHELTHAVTASTADLVYNGESGGLNEAMSDIFGNTVEAWVNGVVDERTWLVGEGVWTPNVPGDAIRYMDDPAKDGHSIDDYNTYSEGTEVHESSGIANLAYKLLVTGGAHPRGKSSAKVNGVGIEKARAIFYRALTRYMSANTTFQGARDATAQAAHDLYGGAVVASVHAAWDAVNVPGSPNGPPGGTGPGPGDHALVNGQPVRNVSGTKGGASYFSIDLPAGILNLLVSSHGGTGDADLYIRYGQKPTTVTFDNASRTTGNQESIALSQTKAGRYWIMVRGFSQFGGLVLTARY